MPSTASYAAAKTIDVSAIPVIDMAPLIEGTADQQRRVAAEFRRAATEIGFFYVKNHNVAQPVIDRALDGAKRFFALPAETKDQVRVEGWHRGFLKVGQVIDERPERAARHDLLFVRHDLLQVEH